MTAGYALVALGGGPASLSAIRGFRDAGGRGRVAIVTDEGRMPYNRPPLTKDLLRGESSEDELALEDEDWLRRERVDLISGHAMLLDPGGRELVLAGGRAVGYDSCVVATGAEPTRPPIPGVDDPAVLVMRSLAHLYALSARLTGGEPVIVVGAGFIGCEIAASLRARGHPVTLLAGETAPNVGRLGEWAAGRIARWLRELGIQTHLGVEIREIERHAGELRVPVGDERLQAPVVVLATGVAPRGELLAPHGLVDDDGAVRVDAHLRTPAPGLLAAGDVALADNATAGRALRVEHWGDALAQGRVAGEVAAGRDRTWDDVPGFWSTIGSHTLKHAAWGDGFDSTQVDATGDGFTVWYGSQGRLVGVLTHDHDADYKRGRDLIAGAADWPPPAG